MPIYEYECQECGHQMDALQKISEPVLVKCPACSKDGLKKLVSAPQFRLKGGGWYETDFKKDNQRNLSKSDSEVPKTGKADKADKADKTGKGDKPGGKADSGKSSDGAAAAKTNTKKETTGSK